MPGHVVKTPERDVPVLWTRGDMRAAVNSHKGAFFHWLTRAWDRGKMPEPVAKTVLGFYLWRPEDAETIIAMWWEHRAKMDARNERVAREKAEHRGRYKRPSRRKQLAVKPPEEPVKPTKEEQAKARANADELERIAAAKAEAARIKAEDAARAERALEFLLSR